MGSTLSARPRRPVGDIQREPALNQIVEDLPASAKGKGGKAFRASVPVYFHVVHANGVGNISQAVIDEQMRVLNAAFAGFYGGPATGFSFSLAGSLARTTPSGTWRESTHRPSAR